MDKLIFGLQVAFIGMGIVFLLLYFLTFVIRCIEFFAREKKNEAKILAPTLKEAAVQVAPATTVMKDDDEDEIAAVLAAAVTAFLGTGYRVNVIRRLPDFATGAWSAAGRTQIMQERQNRQ